MKFISWNVNGLRAAMQKGWREAFDRLNADVFCLQETKMRPEQLQLDLPGYHQFWNSADKAGYSGTAVFSRREPLSVQYGLGIDEHDHEGRLITLEFEECWLVCCYTPNAQDELKRIATQARLGGILSGKAGALQLHMGVGKAGLQMVFDILDETEIPANHFIPTHVNRCAHLFQQAKELARRGGYADLTSGIRTSDGFTGCIEPHEAIHQWWEEGLPMDKLTMSSDGNGSMSVPLPDGGARLLVTKLSSLHEEIIKAVKLGVPLEQAVRVCTSNPAQANKLWPKKGCIRTECDGDLLILNENLQIDSVIARGRVMLEHGTVLVKGTFEE